MERVKHLARKLLAFLNPNANSDPLGWSDNHLWSVELRKHAYGEFSLAVAEANMEVEDQSHVEASRQATFVGVYDGHGGPDTSQYIATHLFDHLNRHARQTREISQSIIRQAVAETERGYLGFVRSAGLFGSRAGGSCCLVGVIWNRTLYVGNMGDSRAVLGISSKRNKIHAEQVTKDHNVNLEEVRIELQARHLGDPNIAVRKNGTWRVRDILQVTRAIGDFNLKYHDPDGLLNEPLTKPYISDEPEVHERNLNEDCRFVIFASDGLWGCMTNQEAVNIVQNNPRESIARRLAAKAMRTAGKKRGKTYTQLKDLEHEKRRDLHDDITVVVIYIDRLDPVNDPDFNPIRVRGNDRTAVPSNFYF